MRNYNTCRLFDSYVIQQTVGTRNNTNQITSDRYFEPNNSLNAVTNAANPFSPQDQSAYDLFFDNSLDGTGVIKVSVRRTPSY